MSCKIVTLFIEIQLISAVQMLYDTTNSFSSTSMFDGVDANCRGYPKNSTNKYFRDNGLVALHDEELVVGRGTPVAGVGVGTVVASSP